MTNVNIPDLDPNKDHTEAFLNGPFLYPALKIITSPVVNEITIRRAYEQWLGRYGRFNILWRYYMGFQRNIREQEDGDGEKSFVVTNFCEYIVKTIKSYIVGNKPMFTHAEGDTYAEQIVEMFEEQNMWKVYSKVVKSLGIFGRAFILVYLDDKGKVKAKFIDPRDGFVAFTDTLDEDSVFGLIRYTDVREDGSEYYRFYVYTQTDLQVWHTEGDKNDKYVQDPVDSEHMTRPHGFGRVPLIEFANNDDYKGDFEGIMGLQDAYNALQSCRLDDENAFAEAILALQGFIIDDNASGVKSKTKSLKDLRVLQMPEEGHAEYLTKPRDEAGVQILQDHFSKDIHKMGFVPDLSDEQFSGNASGVAMAYKLFGTDQIVSDKVALIEDGFKRQCKLYDAVLNNATIVPDYKPKAKISDMTIKFVYNLVQDVGYMAPAIVQMVQTGIMSKQTAMESLSIIEDPIVEAARVKADAAEAIKNAQAMYEDHYTHQYEGQEDEEQPADDDADEDKPPRKVKDEDEDGKEKPPFKA